MLMERPKKVLRSSAITVLLLAGALLSSMLIQEILAADAAVPSLFILAVFLVALIKRMMKRLPLKKTFFSDSWRILCLTPLV